MAYHYIDRRVRNRVAELAGQEYHVETIATVLALEPIDVANLIERCGKAAKWRNAAWRRTHNAKLIPPQPQPDGPTDYELVADSYVPTPDQIAAECERIQSRWSAAERARRSYGFDLPPDPYTIPEHGWGSFHVGTERSGT